MYFNKKVHKLVVRALSRFYTEDWRICWLGSSALWNLARPEEYRHLFSGSIISLLVTTFNQF